MSDVIHIRMTFRVRKGALPQTDATCRNRPAGLNGTGNGKASLDCGTHGDWLWLLRSRPDQIHHSAMRRGPPSGIVQQSASHAKRNHSFQIKFFPDRVHFPADFRCHDDFLPPLTHRFSRPFIGCVNSHFAAQATDGRRKVQIVDRRVVH